MEPIGRIRDLIDYVAATERDKLNIVTDYVRHGGIRWSRPDLTLPGITFDPVSSDEEIWLSVDRLEPSEPPPPPTILAPWLNLSKMFDEEPRLSQEVSNASLVAAGEGDTPGTTKLDDYEHSTLVASAFEEYRAGIWCEWREAERPRRATIKIYGELFALRRMESEGAGGATELIWGIGVAAWKLADVTLRYPLLTVPLEISLSDATRALEVRPRSERQPRPEAEVLEKAGADSVETAEWRRRTVSALAASEVPLSPFRPESFIGILRDAVANFDPGGRFVADPDEEIGPAVGPHLRINADWVIFTRDRRGTELMEDLARLREALQSDQVILPAAVAALGTEPSSTVDDEPLITMRGLSTVPGVTSADGSGEDLFFPLPFNAEQVEVVRRLAHRPGVVVQGPPGTGKTHTIANIVCHYLATGRRVLVTSQKSDALKVLRDKLPEEVRPLAVALLDSDRDGLREFQTSVGIIEGRIASADGARDRAKIVRLEKELDSLHRTLALLDRKADDLGRAARSSVTIDGKEIGPAAAARELAAAGDLAGWIEDKLDIGDAYDPPLTDLNVAELREARKAIGARLSYLGKRLPPLADLPNLNQIERAHRDLSHAENIRRLIASGDLFALRDDDSETLEQCQAQINDLKALVAGRKDILASPSAWTTRIAALLLQSEEQAGLAELETLRAEADRLKAEHRYFVVRPVTLPDGLEDDPRAVTAITNLASGAAPFGLLGSVTAGLSGKRVDAVKLIGSKPTSRAEWSDVARFVEMSRVVKRLALSWNHGVADAGLDAVNGEKNPAASIVAQLDQLSALRAYRRQEQLLSKAQAFLMPGWSRSIVDDDQATELAISHLELHLARGRLSAAETLCERLRAIAGGCEGPVSNEMAHFADELGDERSIGSVAASWQAITMEISALHTLAPQFDCLARLSAIPATAGAPIWSRRLRTEAVLGIEDPLTPGDWRSRWRLCRLATWSDRIDRHDEFRSLETERRETEERLAKVYKDIIGARAWCELAGRATPKVKTSLAAYADAMRRIGKGGGKLAGYWRRAAREAADGSKNALPCWIMPHHRVSESLPSEIGIFDLVIVDEASQSTVAALPAVLRAKQVLIVGDEKQVSPSFVGRPIDRIKALVDVHLGSQVKEFRDGFREDASLYNLGSIVFASGKLMLKEHFRCVAPIIEYSRREFYGGDLEPMRVPTASERLDPPLTDILVEDGFRSGDVNMPEVDCIVEEIGRLVGDPAFERRTIGVTTLLGQKQAMAVADAIIAKLGYDAVERHRIRAGDPAAFQGDERDIMFISMVAAKGDIALTGLPFEQRFNVAASRAKDRMVVVRSIGLSDLRPKDGLRSALIEHFAKPFKSEGAFAATRRERCESPYEKEVFDLLSEKGFRVDTQVRVGSFRIDLVVEGDGDRRLAIECDGDRWHAPEQWPEDMARQRQLERAGWRIWRCFASRFVRERRAVTIELFDLLANMGIEPASGDEPEVSAHTEHRRWRSKPVSERGVEPEPTAVAAVTAAQEPATRVISPVLGDEDEPTETVETIISGRRRLSRSEALVALSRYREEIIARDYPGHEPNRCILRVEIAKELVAHRCDNPESFAAAVPLFMRERIDARQLRYLPDICEIVALVSGDEGPNGVKAPRQADFLWEEPFSLTVQPNAKSSNASGAASPESSRPRHVVLMPNSELVDAIVGIVDREGPIHRDEIARRLVGGPPGTELEPAVVNSVMRGLNLAKQNGTVKCNGVIWSAPDWRRR